MQIEPIQKEYQCKSSLNANVINARWANVKKVSVQN